MRKAPAWAHAELDRWAQSITGTLRFEVLDGIFKKFRREDVVEPQTDETINKHRTCPICDKQMDVEDYGSRYRCECGGVWTIYELRRLRETPKPSTASPRRSFSPASR